MNDSSVIFVDGLPRSGTTLVHFLIGGHPRCVALGEVQRLIGDADVVARGDTVECSCGVMADRCRFWRDLLPRLRGDGDYQPLLRHFASMYPGRVLVDSSKRIPPEGARTVYVIRDVRAWTVSLGHTTPRFFARWHRENRRRMPGKFVVSYEELALRPVPSLQRICKHLGLDYTPEMFDFARSEHHAVKCNRMRSNEAKMTSITYDHRWFHQDRWMLPALLMPQVMKFNRKHVYGYVEDVFDSSSTSR